MKMLQNIIPNNKILTMKKAVNIQKVKSKNKVLKCKMKNHLIKILKYKINRKA